MKELDFTSMLPPLLLGDELVTAMTCLPSYDASVRTLSASERLMQLTNIYKVFVPTSMATEIYQRVYMMTTMSLQNKGSIASVRQMNANYTWSHGGEYHGVATGATSATVIGISGIGKTSCIQSAINLLGPIIETENPCHKIIPIVMVSCPFDCSYKGLLCQILISIDEILGTDYYNKTQRSKMNSQQILGMVCQLCHLHVGLLIIDEVQLLSGATQAGSVLYRMILQLINTSCINVLLVGTSECLRFFSETQQIARRSVGLQYGAMEFGGDFRRIAEILYSYQYVKQDSKLTENVLYWLYEHTGGVPAILTALIHDAQEIAILRGREALGIEALTEAYSSRMRMLHSYLADRIEPKITTTYHEKPKSINTANVADSSKSLPDGYMSVEALTTEARNKQLDIIELMRSQFAVEEVML
jgi:hypothetical protein